MRTAENNEAAETAAAQLEDKPVETIKLGALLQRFRRRDENLFDMENVIPRQVSFEPVKETGAFVAMDAGEGFMPLTRDAFSQVCRRLKVPYKYAVGLHKHDPEFLCETLHRQAKDSNDAWLVRGVQNGDQKVRAVLRNAWACFDNVDLLTMLQDSLKDAADNVKLLNTGQNISDLVGDNMALGLIVPNKRIGKRDDRYFPALSIYNSEIGNGQTRVDGALYRMICTNGMRLSDEDGERSVVFSQYNAARQIGHLHESILNTLKFAVEGAEDAQKKILNLRKRAIKGLRSADSDVADQLRSLINKSTKTSHGKPIIDLFLGRDDHSVHGLVQAVSRYANEVPAVDAERLRRAALALPEHANLRRLTTKAAA